MMTSKHGFKEWLEGSIENLADFELGPAPETGVVELNKGFLARIMDRIDNFFHPETSVVVIDHRR